MARAMGGVALVFAACVTLFLANEGWVVRPAYASSSQCCRPDYESWQTPVPGDCVFMGFCPDGSPLPGAWCQDDIRMGQTPCSSLSATSIYVPAECKPSNIGPCHLGQGMRPTHFVTGSCLAPTPTCACNCGGVFGAATGNQVQVAICAASPSGTPSEICP